MWTALALTVTAVLAFAAGWIISGLTFICAANPLDE